jgi:hypothetical protein
LEQLTVASEASVTVSGTRNGNVKVALNSNQVKSLQAGVHADGGGLYLVVRESGDRVWAFRFTAAKIQAGRQQAALRGGSFLTADLDPAHLRWAAREPHRNRLDRINRSLEQTSTAIQKISLAEYAPDLKAFQANRRSQEGRCPPPNPRLLDRPLSRATTQRMERRLSAPLTATPTLRPQSTRCTTR